jgi:tRNA(Ile)-lysidine synthase
VKATHAPSLRTRARATLLREVGVRRGERILVAVSGGGDSTALLHVLAALRAPLGVDLVAHGVDHGLRRAATAELDGAEALAQALRVPFARSRVSLRPGGNLQARAREPRWAALEDAARGAGATYVATAHHADDRAETVLLRLLRGAPPEGLAVLPPRDGVRIRPFVRARRADVTAYLARHRLPFADDPSNRSPRFLRARVRHEVLPLLERLSPSVVGHLCSLADGLWSRRDGEAAPLYRIPRATQQALSALAGAPRRGPEILLPGGLVARWEGPGRCRGA